MKKLNRTDLPPPRTADQILEDLEWHFEEIQHRRAARLLGASLLHKLHIRPDGIQCVCLLADASCKNNAEAIQKWVGEQLLDPELHSDPNTPVIDQLLRRLNRHLINLEAANS